MTQQTFTYALNNKKYNFINIGKNCQNVFPNFCDFAKNFDEWKFWECACSPWTPRYCITQAFKSLPISQYSCYLQKFQRRYVAIFSQFVL